MGNDFIFNSPLIKYHPVISDIVHVKIPCKITTMVNDTDVDQSLKACHCGDLNVDEEKTFLYVEGTQMDKTLSEDDSSLTETVWYNVKPPKLFSIDYFPAVTARQVQIKRIQLQGKRKLAGDEKLDLAKERVSISKKKSAVKFLSTTSIGSA
ncbi:hypothetical protein ABEB36_012493 [Hypothenemus hampei]|uniref:Uncharacterized protein n=1 Tax=Hypothenemus hampei TaxID=57062 RepID=A0ABD1EBS0_HYPHA